MFIVFGSVECFRVVRFDCRQYQIEVWQKKNIFSTMHEHWGLIKEKEQKCQFGFQSFCRQLNSLRFSYLKKKKLFPRWKLKRNNIWKRWLSKCWGYDPSRIYPNHLRCLFEQKFVYICTNCNTLFWECFVLLWALAF